MRLYVAAASAQVARADRFMRRLRDAGHIVTSTWPDSVREHGANEGVPVRVAIDAARENFAGIRSADAVLLLAPPSRVYSHGAYYEAGFATALNKPLMVIGDRESVERSVFNWDAQALCLDEDAAIRMLAEGMFR